MTKGGAPNRTGRLRWLVLAAVPLAWMFIGSARALSAGRPARSLLNLEAVLAGSLTLLTIVLARGGAESNSCPRSISRWFALALAALVALAYWPARHFGFVGDDFILVQNAIDFSTDQLWRLLTKGGGDGFYRPVVDLLRAGLATLAGIRPEYWHLVSGAIHAANGVLVYGLAQRLRLSKWEAFFAAVLFEIHGANPETVVWTSSLFQMFATLFTLAGLNLFLSAENRTPQATRLLLAGSCVAMVLAILSKESAYTFPLLLAVVAATRGDPPRVWLRRSIPFLAVAGLLFGYRFWLFGGLGGYRSPGGDVQAVHLGWPTLNALFGRLWATLYFPVNWTARPGPVLIGLAAFYLMALACTLLGTSPRRQLAGAAAFTAISALPALHLLLIGADLEKSRMLYLPCVGFSILIATMASGAPKPLRATIITAILLFQMAALQHNMSQWGYVAVKARTTCEVARLCAGVPATSPPGGLPRTILGVPFLANGFPQCVAMAIDAPSPTRPKGTIVWDSSRQNLLCSVP